MKQAKATLHFEGYCSGCGVMVWNDQFRRYDEQGHIYHVGCIEAKEKEEINEIRH